MNSAMKFLCVLGIMAQSAAVLWAGNPATDSDNLFTYPAGWAYGAGDGLGKWELTQPGQERQQCIRLWSDKPGYHGGSVQRIALKRYWRYKYSAWVKANIAEGGKVTLLYHEGHYTLIQAGQKTKKSWGGQAGETNKSFDWQYVERTFETPSVNMV